MSLHHQGLWNGPACMNLCNEKYMDLRRRKKFQSFYKFINHIARFIHRKFNNTFLYFMYL